MRRWFVLALAAPASALVLLTLAGACGEADVACPIKPGLPGWDDPYCMAWRGEKPDAGADASDSSPGFGPQSAVCIENPPDGFEGPQPFWHGPKDHRPSACPDEIGSYGGEGFSDLVVTALQCPTCVCKASKKAFCSPTPTIDVRTEICIGGASSTIDFTPSANWDGSCTNAKTLPAGAQCPPGSGKLCASSVFASALPDPINECEPDELPIVKGWDNYLHWAKAGLSCSASEAAPAGTSCGASQASCGANGTCRYPLPSTSTPEEAWRWCVHQSGVVDCPTPSVFTERFVIYEDAAIEDNRTCTACSCAGEGGACYGTLRAYADEACSTPEILTNQKDSSKPSCGDLTPPGQAIGSIEITDQFYVPGTCKASGGMPTGDLTLNPDKAVTWCCQPPTLEPMPQK